MRIFSPQAATGSAVLFSDDPTTFAAFFAPPSGTCRGGHPVGGVSHPAAATCHPARADTVDKCPARDVEPSCPESAGTATKRVYPASRAC
ncbi:MAG: hypothetical protein ACYSWO_30725, partial [Planctomycetota bacterium]